MSVDFPKPEDLDAREAELKTVLECIATILHKDDRTPESPFDFMGRGLQLQHEIFQTYLGMILPQSLELARNCGVNNLILAYFAGRDHDDYP